MAEKYYDVSPYCYCADNPVAYVDPSGKWLETAWDIVLILHIHKMEQSQRHTLILGIIPKEKGIMNRYKLKIAQSDGVTLQFVEYSPCEAVVKIQEVEMFVGAMLNDVANDIIRGFPPPSWLQISIKATDIISRNIDISDSKETCLIIWDKHSADYVPLLNLVDCFDYYWYESCDDIFVVHVEKREIYFIRHDGIIYKHMTKF